jgi:DNA-binding LytR/AlgR family response regulator
MSSTISSLNFLLVDDNVSFLSILEILLIDLGAKHILKAATASSGYDCFIEHAPDICLLDIELTHGKKDGAELARKIRSINPDVPIIFLTSYFHSDYYEDVKDALPSSFMNKELSRLKVLQAIELAARQISKKGANHQAKLAAGNQLEKPAKASSLVYYDAKQIFFKVGDAIKPIKISEIDYFYAESKLTYAKMGRRTFPTSVQLKVLEEELAPQFLRCHKKYLVNTDRISSVKLREGKLEIGGDSINIGFVYRKTFMKGLHLIK